MNLNIEEWEEFKTEKLFSIMQIGKANQQMLDEGKECFYVGAKKDDNGVMLHCKKDLSLLQKGNCIIFICNGQGSVGFANYMDVDFIGTTDIVAGYNESLNYYNGVFLATLYSKERPKYSFGRKWKTHLKETVIKLPIQFQKDENGEYVLDEHKNKIPIIDISKKYSEEGYVPDWQFMEDYIKSLRSKQITTKNKKGQVPNLKVNDWKEFKINKLFEVNLAKGDIKYDEVEKGNIPLISSGESNNGIVGYISREGDGKSSIFYGNKITVDMFCNAYYQEEDFYSVSHGRVNILRPLFEMNRNIGLFISTIISKEKLKFSYGRAVYSNVISNVSIKLPIQLKSDGTPYIDTEFKYSEDGYVPDWQFMEEYIKSLPYGDKLSLKEKVYE